MGASSDIMHEFVVKEIRNYFSSYDGWSFTTRDTGDGYDTLVLLERRNGGHRECTNVLVTFSASVPSPLPDELMKPACSADGTPTRVSCAVMVPANADISTVSPEIMIYVMKSFQIKNKELSWVKKRVCKCEPAAAKAKA